MKREIKNYHSNGQIKIHCFMENEKLHGEYKTFYSTGQLKLHCFYKDGKLHGKYEEYTSKGDLLFSGIIDWNNNDNKA